MTVPLPRTEVGQRTGLLIPRVFHRIWLGGPLPERERRLGDTWAAHHPGWEMRLWHEGNLPSLVNRAQFDAATTPAQKVDILRCELLLEHGGVFLDTDLECVGTIEPLLDGVRAFVCREDAVRVSTGIMGSVPGHPFSRRLVAELPDSIAWRPGRPPGEQTGRELLTRVLVEQEALGAEVPTVLAPDLLHRAGSRHGTRGVTEGATAEPDDTSPTGPGADVERVVVEVDPQLLTESGAVVLTAAMRSVGPVTGAELALVLCGVPTMTPEIGDALAGIIRTLASGTTLPEVVAYSEPEGAALPAVLRVAATDVPGAVSALEEWAARRADSGGGPAPAGRVAAPGAGRTPITAGAVRRPYLVVARAGNSSLHPSWIEGERNFDLAVDYYGSVPGRWADTADHYSTSGGTKWPSVHALLTANPHLLDGYRAVWFPDDDIATDAATISTMFQLHTELGMGLSQPSLSEDSYFSHLVTLKHPGFAVRVTNFVEVMAPLFSREALRACLATFDQSRSGYGLDLAWQSILPGVGLRSAIFDCLSVRHTRPVGGGTTYDELTEPANQEGARIARAYGMSYPHPLATVEALDSSFRRLTGDRAEEVIAADPPRPTVQAVPGWDPYLPELVRRVGERAGAG